MKKSMKLLALFCGILLVSLIRTEDSQDNENEGEDDYIDSGCIKSKPALCPDGKCYADYSYCEILHGCKGLQNPLMCPSGHCVDSFSDCRIKSYKCAITNFQLCPDGKCRRTCKHIRTNGCSA